MNNKIIVVTSLLFLSAFSGVFAAPLDSLRLEKKEGKTFLIHKVEPKETLYSISRKYSVPPAEVIKANPEVAKAMKVGDLVKVPYSKSVTSSKTTATAVNKETAKVTTAQTDSDADREINENAVIEHTVKTGETLYKIAQKYEVKVADLAKWNHIKSGEGVKVGQKLKVYALTEEEEEQPKKVEEKPKVIAPPKDQKEKFTTKQPEKINNIGTVLPQPGVDTVVYSKTSYKEGAVEKVKQSGIAEVVDSKDLQEKYLAYSNELPAGTMIKVKNIETEEFVFLKVVGKIQSTNRNVILEIGAKAKDRLDSKYNTFKVEVSYVK